MIREISRYPTIRRPASRRGGRARTRLIVETLERRDVPSFAAANLLPAGGSPQALAVADFNADSLDDLVVANAAGNIRVLLGQGDGTFDTGTTYIAFNNPEDVTVGDFNNDGRIDIANTNWGSDSATVFLGNGDGTFQPALSSNAGFQPFGIASEDFDEDGDADIVVTNKWVSGGVSLLRNDGNATFQLYATLEITPGLEVVRVADFNEDGHADLLTGMRVLLGNGNGSFQPPTPSVGSAADMAIADINSDGHADIIGTSGSQNMIGVYAGNGDGTFQAPKMFPAGQDPIRLAVADLDGDGDTDVVAGSNDYETITVMRNVNGSLRRRTTYVVGDTPAATAVGDFKSDGIPDIVTGNDSSSTLSIVLGIGSSFFNAPTGFYLTSAGSRAITAADVMGDSSLDLVVVSGSSSFQEIKGYAEVLKGTGNGAFKPGPTYDVFREPTAVVAQDLNGDGFSDFAFVHDESFLTVLPGNASGYANPPQYDAGVKPTDVDIGDLNNDGIVDLVVPDDGEAGGVTVYLGNGDGSFTPGTKYPGLVYNNATLADLNNDGALDLVLGSAVSNYVWTALGNENGTFTPYVKHSVGAKVSQTEASDFNADGNLDLALVLNGGLVVMRGNGDGTFQPPGSSLAAGAETVATADLNNDGALDLAVGVDSGTDGVYLVLGNGDGSFSAPSLLISTPGPNDIGIADLNGDGHLDIVAAFTDWRVALGNGDGTFQPAIIVPNLGSDVAIADINGNSIPDLVGAFRVSNGNGNGTFKPRATYFAGFSPVAVAVGDLNGDGFNDLAGISENKLRILLNEQDGTFPAATGYSANSASGLATGDFNGDGLLDLVTANRNPGTVSVYLANGTPGGYLGPFTFPVQSGPRDVVVDDFNGDSIPDIVASNRTTGTVSVLLSNGDGTFQAAVNSAAGTFPYYLTTNDLNADGAADLVIANDSSAGTLNVLLGNGDGTFQAPQAIPTGTGRCHEIVVTDLNNDGILDVATAAPSAVVVMLGNGDGTFQTPLAYAALNSSTSMGLTSGDFNNDGFVDLAVVNSKAVVVLLNDGIWPPMPIGGGLNPAIQLGTENRPSKTVVTPNADETVIPEDRTLRSSVIEPTAPVKTPATTPKFRPELRAPPAAGLADLDLKLE